MSGPGGEEARAKTVAKGQTNETYDAPFLSWRSICSPISAVSPCSSRLKGPLAPLFRLDRTPVNQSTVAEMNTPVVHPVRLIRLVSTPILVIRAPALTLTPTVALAVAATALTAARHRTSPLPQSVEDGLPLRSSQVLPKLERERDPLAVLLRRTARRGAREGLRDARAGWSGLGCGGSEWVSAESHRR